MSQPKDKVPAHIKPKEFQHPETGNRIVLILSEIEDPRKPSCNFRHSLISILFISLIGLLCGAKDWEEVVQAREKLLNIFKIKREEYEALCRVRYVGMRVRQKNNILPHRIIPSWHFFPDAYTYLPCF